jgi:hypothetical protein
MAAAAVAPPSWRMRPGPSWWREAAAAQAHLCEILAVLAVCSARTVAKAVKGAAAVVRVLAQVVLASSAAVGAAGLALGVLAVSILA